MRVAVTQVFYRWGWVGTPRRLWELSFSARPLMGISMGQVLINYLKEADALFPPPTLGSCSWGHIPQALCQRGKAPLDSPVTILR